MPEQQRTGRVGPFFLNLRAGPSTSEAVVGLLAPDTPFTLMAQVGEWLEIQAGRNSGYVHEQFVVLDDEVPPAPPPIIDPPPTTTPQARSLPMTKLPIGINVGHYEELINLPLIVNNRIDEAQVDRFGLREFRVLRFMDWQKVNNSDVVDWDDLPRPEENWPYRGGPWASFKGVPLELCIEMANLCDASAWICIPHRATDDTIRRMVDMVLERATETPIFEYSNEVWNGQFQQHHYATEKGQALGFDRANAFRGALHFQAKRTEFISSVVDARGYVVIAAQAGNPFVAQLLLSETGIGNHVDALALGPYFGHKTQTATSLFGLRDELINFIEGELRSNVRAHRVSAESHSLPIWGYEGGQHLRGDNPLFAQINRSPIMQEIIGRWFNMWYQEGGDLLCPYSLYSVYGRDFWGFFELEENGRLIGGTKRRALADAYEALLA